MSTNNRNELIVRTSLFIASILFSLFATEVVVRILSLAPEVSAIAKGRFRLADNPKIAYEPIPNISYTGESLDFYNYRGTANKLGFRGPVYPEANGKSIYRIIVIGDSITEGIGINRYEEVYTCRLETQLSQPGRKAEVINLGVSGYNTQQEVETLVQKGLRFEPDLVIVGYSLNDTESPYYHILYPLLREAKNNPESNYSAESLVPYLSYSAIFRFIYYRVLVKGKKNTNSLEYKAYNTGNTVSKYFGKLEELSEIHGFDVLVVVFPRFDKPKFENYGFHKNHRFVRNESIKNGFHFLDLLTTYTEYAKTSAGTFIRDPLHPSSEGHGIAAQAINSYILKKLIYE